MITIGPHYNGAMVPIFLWLWLLTAGASLSDADRAQLTTADDGGPFDEAALYPLLRAKATGEEPEPAEPVDAAEPDYEALRAEPAAWRGERFTVEGRFAGRSRRLTLARPGPWGEAVTEWGLIVRDDPQEVAMVLLIDPAESLAPPPTGATVRVTARFYKLWGDRDLNDRPYEFLTFVAPAATVKLVETHTSPVPPTDGVGGTPLLLLAIVTLAAGYIVARLYIGRTARRTATRRVRGEAPTPSGPADSEASPALPPDPAEALARMDRRAKADAHDAPPPS